MGFREVKSTVIECLNKGFVLHDVRNDIDVKNLLQTGAISLSDVATIIGRARGNTYSSSSHHYDAEIEVHVIKTTHDGQHWYIKWYFKEPNSVFISVHEQTR